MRTRLIAMVITIAALGSSVPVLVPVSHAQGDKPGRTAADENAQVIAATKGFWRELHEEHDPNAVPKYVSESYVEAGGRGTNGRPAITRILGQAPPAGRGQTIVYQNAFVHSPYVLMVQDREMANPAQPGATTKFNTVEMFEVYNGMIQTHRMFFAEGRVPARFPPHSEQGLKNIALVKGFLHDVREARDGNAAVKYIATDYVEHGTGSDDATNGRDALVKRYETPPAGTSSAGPVPQDFYPNGPFVLVLENGGKAMEMFKVYDGLIQEHWLFLPQGEGLW
jgi:predicted SnoaL-like aldol condensation-catalyzing enzyme